MTPVCVKCNLEMKVKKNGVILIPMMAPSAEMAIYRADLHWCPHCGIEVVSSVAKRPELNHFDAGFKERLAAYDNDKREKVIRYWANLVGVATCQ